jgi:phosphoserine phosphatase RsbU/P
MLVRLHPHVRLAIALAFGAASTLYSVVWIAHSRSQRPAPVVLGIEYESDVGSRQLRVTGVSTASPAAAAGLQVGDRLLAVNGQPLVTREPLREELRKGTPGEAIELLLHRPGHAQPERVAVILGSRPPAPLAERAVSELIGTYPLLFLIVGLSVLFQRLTDPHAWRLALMFAGDIASAPIELESLPAALGSFATAYVIVFRSLSSALFYAFFALFPAPARIHVRWPGLLKVGLGTAAGLAAMFAVRAVAGQGSPLSNEPARWVPDIAVRLLVAVYGSVFLTLGVASLLWNAVASDNSETRRKSRVLVGGTLAAVPAIVLTVAGIVPGQPIYYLFPFWIWAPSVLLLLLMPVSFAYAVVKHRVLEIPVLLRRSARYVLVLRGFTALVIAAAVGVTIGFGSWLARSYALRPDVAIPVGAGLGVSVAWVGTASRRRVTRRIDRAFFRDAYDARQILEELGNSSRLTTDRAQLAALLERHIVRALHPTFVLVYLVETSGALRSMQGLPPPGLERLPADHPWLQSVAAAGRPLDRQDHSDTGAFGGPFGDVGPDCLVPMLGRVGQTGLLVVGPRRSEEPYSGEDLRLLGTVAAQAGLAAESIALGERIAERVEAERLAAREIEIAREVQAQLLPQRRPPLRTLDYEGVCVQARVVGGDYYDFLDLGPGLLGFVLADISGKGIAAALLMANLQANLRGHYAMAVEDPVRLLVSVNHLFYESTTPNRFATVFFARYEDASRRLTYVNCGHNPPLVVRAGATVETLEPTATALGFFDDLACETRSIRLDPGDTLVAYTDGIVEALNDDGEEFGVSRLVETILAHRDAPPGELLGAILKEVQRFSGSEQEDDLTLVVATALDGKRPTDDRARRSARLPA